MNVPCVSCKGRGFCGRPFCPIYTKAQSIFKIVKKMDKEDFFSATPPSVFIGSKLNYPAVNVGILSPFERSGDTAIYDDPLGWARNNYNIKQIINFRSSLVNSRFRASVFDIRKESKFLELSQEIGMAAKPVSVEIELKKKLKFKLDFNSMVMPMGPAGQLKKVRVTENPKISSKVEKVVSDTDLKAIDGLNYLYSKGFTEYDLSKLLSVGVLGVKKKRRLVPTRWSITAIDDNVGKELLKRIRDYKQVNDYALYFNGYFGNYYLILFFPEIFSYELFETYLPKSVWNPSLNVQTVTDYEGFEGRKNYAENCAGGYYAARYSILQFLENIKRQASVLVLRFVTPEYAAPLGVWVCREAVRKTLQTKPVYFDSKEELIREAKRIIYKNFRFDIIGILKQSKILKNIKNQIKLTRFF